MGVYNGEGYNRSEANTQKAFQVRATIRPAPAVNVLLGLRLTGFWDADHYIRDGDRDRVIGALFFEHPWVHVGFNYMKARDQARIENVEINSEGWSAWVTPRTPIGIEGLFRYDHLEPDDRNDSEKNRTIAGIAYWFTFPKPGVTTALLADYEKVEYDDFAPARPTEKRYALHMLVNF